MQRSARLNQRIHSANLSARGRPILARKAVRLAAVSLLLAVGWGGSGIAQVAPPANVLVRVPGLNDAQRNMAGSIDAVCPNIGGAGDPALTQQLSVVCSNMVADGVDIVGPGTVDPPVAGFGLDADGLGNALQSINGEEIQAAQSRVTEVRGLQVGNIAARMQAVRTGRVGPGLQVSGLSFDGGDTALAGLDGVRPSLQDFEIVPAQWLNDTTWSKLGVFVTGGLQLGDKDSTGQSDGFDFDSFGLTVGADYRVTDQFVWGAALGYSNFDADFDTTANTPAGEGLQSDSLLASLFASFSLPQGLFVDGIATIGTDGYDSTRRIVIPGAIDETADGDFDAFHYGVAANVGYDIPVHGFTVTPVARAEYIKADLDGFTETGAGALNLTFGDQNAESLTTNLGVEASYPISTEVGVFVPSVRAEYVHEYLNDDDGVTVSYAADNTATKVSAFNITTETADSDYGILGAAVAVTVADGWSAFVDYSTVVALSDFDIHNVNVGFRKQF